MPKRCLWGHHRHDEPFDVAPPQRVTVNLYERPPMDLVRSIA